MSDDKQNKPKKTETPSKPWQGDPNLRTYEVANAPTEGKPQSKSEKGIKADKKD